MDTTVIHIWIPQLYDMDTTVILYGYYSYTFKKYIWILQLYPQKGTFGYYSYTPKRYIWILQLYSNKAYLDITIILLKKISLND